MQLSENKSSCSYSVSFVIWKMTTLLLSKKFIEQNNNHNDAADDAVCKWGICSRSVKFWSHSGEQKQMPSASGDHSYCVSNIVIN